MDDNGELDPSTEFSPESSWTLSDDVYFFGTDRESSILREFGWNLQPELRFGDFDRIVPELTQGARVSLPESSTVSSAAQAGAVEKVGDASMLNQSVSSSSSEDPAEKSTDSGAGGKLPAKSA